MRPRQWLVPADSHKKRGIAWESENSNNSDKKEVGNMVKTRLYRLTRVSSDEQLPNLESSFEASHVRG